VGRGRRKEKEGFLGEILEDKVKLSEMGILLKNFGGRFPNIFPL
jgi:hypothetical protein